MEVTMQIIRAAGADAGNRSMRKGGRTSWNEDDYNVAAETMRRLVGQMFDVPQPAATAAA